MTLGGVAASGAPSNITQLPHRQNNFDAIRLVGALLVLVGHAFPLHGRPSAWVFGQPVQALGVILFFSVSGYLISQSWAADRNLARYLTKRFLRIFPALIVVTLLCAFVLGPAISTLSVGNYLGNPGTWQFLRNALLFPVYALPGVFDTNIYPAAVNGSVWSLPAEFVCYLIVPIVGLLPRRAHFAIYLALGMASGFWGHFWSLDGTRVVVYGTDLSQAATVWAFFLVGAALSSARWIPIRTGFALVGFLVTAVANALSPEYMYPVWWLIFPYVVLSFGLSSTKGVHQAGRWGDFSYGLYLYAFPVQQTFIRLWPSMPWVLSALGTLVVSLLAAFVSWHVIEKQALRLKPGRRSKMATSEERAERADAIP